MGLLVCTGHAAADWVMFSFPSEAPLWANQCLFSTLSKQIKFRRTQPWLRASPKLLWHYLQPCKSLWKPTSTNKLACMWVVSVFGHTLLCVCVRVKGIFGEWSVKKDTLGRKLTGLQLNLWRRYFECCKITGGVEAFSITNPLGIQMLWIYGTYVRLATVARNLIMCGL